jgi:hypothetical protein
MRLSALGNNTASCPDQRMERGANRFEWHYCTEIKRYGNLSE